MLNRYIIVIVIHFMQNLIEISKKKLSYGQKRKPIYKSYETIWAYETLKPSLFDEYRSFAFHSLQLLAQIFFNYPLNAQKPLKIHKWAKFQFVLSPVQPQLG